MPRIRDIPPTHCTARSKQSGLQCKRYAIPGGLVCPAHGGKAPQVAHKAALRSLASYLESDPRSALEVITEAVAIGDAAVREARQAILDAEAAGEPITPEMIDRALSLATRSAALGKVKADARIDERIVDRAERLDEHVADVIYETISSVVAKLIDSLAPLGLDPTARAGLAAWSRRSATAKLGAAGRGEDLAGIELEDPPVPVLSRLAIEAGRPTNGHVSSDAVSAAAAAVEVELSTPEPEIVDAEIVPDEEPEQPPARGPRTGWSPPGYTNPWSRGLNPMSQNFSPRKD